jgi:hypothetical protein
MNGEIYFVVLTNRLEGKEEIITVPFDKATYAFLEIPRKGRSFSQT